MISAYLNGNELSFAYDSANRLISAGQNSYTYNVEDVCVRNLCGESETSYAYNTNGRLSQLLVKTTDGVIMTIECRNNTSLRYFYAKLKIWHQIFFENLSIFIAMKLIQNRRAILYSRFYRLVENSKSFRHSIIIITKYVYGIGLIGEETSGSFKTYHFDYRGSTAAITDINGNVTDTFEYDTYGNLISRTGTSAIIFLYNGRDGVVTDSNGLIYMRARYYSPELRRFINADIIAGEISNAVTLNRYAYANGNPVSNIDPFGLSAERGNNKVFSGLEGLYNLAFGYYSYVFNKSDRVNFSNDAVMKYIIYKQYYEVGFANNIAWELISGPVDYGFINYMEQYTDYVFLQGNCDFYDPSSGNKIDFSHLIGTLSANNFYRQGMGMINDSLNAYAGWAGDLITLAGDAQVQKDKGAITNVVQYVKNALGGTDTTSFSQNDLLADIDAVLINRKMSNKPIYQVFRDYYSSDLTNRYTNFVSKEFLGITKLIKASAEEFLSPSITTNLFKKVFHSSYKQNIINDVAKEFSEYIIENMR